MIFDISSLRESIKRKTESENKKPTLLQNYNYTMTGHD